MNDIEKIKELIRNLSIEINKPAMNIVSALCDQGIISYEEEMELTKELSPAT